MKCLYFLLLLFPMFSNAQQVSDMKKYRCLNGWNISKNGELILGTPSGESFKYISLSPSSKDVDKRLKGDCKGSVVQIDGIRHFVWDNGNENYFAVFKLGSDKYYLDVEPAISSGELSIPEGYSRKVDYKISMRRDLELNSTKYENLIDSIPVKENRIFFDKVLLANDQTKKELFVKIRQWLVENFMDSKAVLEVNDAESGLLTGKGTFKYAAISGLTTYEGWVTFIINIAVKDGKFRYQLYNFRAKGEKSEFDIFSSTGSRKTDEEFLLDSALEKYYRGSSREKKVSKQYLTKLTWLAKYIDTGLTEIANDKSNDISDF